VILEVLTEQCSKTKGTRNKSHEEFWPILRMTED